MGSVFINLLNEKGSFTYIGQSYINLKSNSPIEPAKSPRPSVSASIMETTSVTVSRSTDWPFFAASINAWSLLSVDTTFNESINFNNSSGLTLSSLIIIIIKGQWVRKKRERGSTNKQQNKKELTSTAFKRSIVDFNSRGHSCVYVYINE